MNSVAVGLFRGDRLVSLHSNYLLDPGALRHRVLAAHKTFRKSSVRQFYDDNGFLVTVDDVRGFSVLVATADDFFPLNRATAGRVAKLLKDSQNELSFEVLTSLDVLVTSSAHQKDLLENLNRGLSDSPAADAGQPGDALAAALERPPLEAENLRFIFQGLKFDFLKEEPLDAGVFQPPQPERTMEQQHFDQFMVTLDSWERGEKPQEPVRISLAPDKPKNSMQILMRNSALGLPDARARPVLTLDEQLRIQVRETEIVEIQVRGRVLLANAGKGAVVAVDVGADVWDSDTLIRKHVACSAAAGTVQSQPGNFRFTALEGRSGQPVALWEYTLNPKVVTDETIPIYFAYNQLRNLLALQVRIHPSFAARVTRLRIKVLCSHVLEEGAVRSSLVGTCADNAFVMTVDRQTISSEVFQIKMQMQEPGVAFLRVAAECVVARTLLDFDMRPRGESESGAVGVEGRLAIDYTLVL